MSQSFVDAFWSALQVGWHEAGDVAALGGVQFESREGALPSAFAVSDFAAASMAALGLALKALARARGEAQVHGDASTRSTQQAAQASRVDGVSVDRRLASFWFASSIRPLGWSLPPLWDAVAGDYLAQDGWVRLHTNAAHHREAALQVLTLTGQAPDRERVAQAVATWRASELEQAVVDAGGCAAAMRSKAAWHAHPQGLMVAREALIDWTHGPSCPNESKTRHHRHTTEQPLRGMRVLDLTRILAGPIATRALAGLGAEVLRIDPIDWEEPSVAPEVTLGKRCARLNLKTPADRERLDALLEGADVLVHGYRPDALEHLGWGEAHRRARNPGLIDVSLCAYGWSGPWAQRRAFDSLVQMSCGIADAGRAWKAHARGATVNLDDKPVPLPVQALDHAAGYLMAAAAVQGLAHREATGRGVHARTSLARVAAELMDATATPSSSSSDAATFAPESPDDLQTTIERTSWGDAKRLMWPLDVPGVRFAWPHPATALGSADAAWLA